MQTTKYPLKVTFHKTGEIIYFSQLDLVRIIERALRRAGLPLYVTQGFNPHVKISFANALKLGIEGKIEAVLYFITPVSGEELKTKLTPQLPQGLKILVD